MRTVISRILTILTISTLFASCATTSLVDTWHNPGSAAQKHHKLLAVYVSRNDSVRRVYEDIQVNELKQKAIETEPGHMFISGGSRAERPALEKGIKESGADGLITVQLIRIAENVVIEPGYVPLYPDYWYPPAFPTWNMYGYFGAFPYIGPPDIATYKVGRLQVNLFDAQSGKLQWAGTVKTSEPGDIVTVAKKLTRIIVQKLTEEGFI
jgi:hypothetical protein